MSFKADMFKVIPETELNEAMFDYFPVWSEHYDWEEIEDIERWGLDRNVVLELFKKNERGNLHCLYTCLEHSPFPERMRLFIKATLKTKGGIQLKGYIMNENAFCLAIFVQGKKYYFSRHPMLIDQFNMELARLSSALGVNSKNIFPIHYETTFYSRTGNRILGVFDIEKA